MKQFERDIRMTGIGQDRQQKRRPENACANMRVGGADRGDQFAGYLFA